MKVADSGSAQEPAVSPRPNGIISRRLGHGAFPESQALSQGQRTASSNGSSGQVPAHLTILFIQEDCMRNKTGFIIFFLVALAVVSHPGPGGAVLGGQAGGGHCQDPRGHRPGHDPPRHAQGVHGDSRRAPSFLAVLHPMGHLGRLDLFLGGRLRRHHGRGGAYLGLRSVGLCRYL